MEPSGEEKRACNAGAAFRIFGTGLDLDAITHQLCISPDHRHTRGELDPGNRPYSRDMWSLASPLGKDRTLDLHLIWLAERLLNHKTYLLSLKESFTVDIYCWQDCFTEQASLMLSSKALKIFTDLDLDLEVGLLCLGPEESTRASDPLEGR